MRSVYMESMEEERVGLFGRGGGEDVNRALWCGGLDSGECEGDGPVAES